MSAAVQKEAFMAGKRRRDGRIRCLLCPPSLFADGRSGWTLSRSGGYGKGVLRSLIYGLVSAAASGSDGRKRAFLSFSSGRGYFFSVGSWGCNMALPFLSELGDFPIGAWKSRAAIDAGRIYCRAAAGFGGENCGLAFTYMEPLVWFEYILEAAKLAKGTRLGGGDGKQTV